MLEIKQLESGTPPDIEVSTDDSQAELASINDLFIEHDINAEEFKAAKNLDEAQPGEDGQTTFVIPGDEAPLIADVWPELATQLDRWNAEAAERAAERAAAQQ